MNLTGARTIAKAQDAFEKLETKLKALQPQAGPQNFTPEQSKQFARDYGWALSRLGDTYHKQREYDKAIERYESGLVILERVLQNEPAAILFETYHGLAHAYHDNAKFRSVAVYAGPTTVALTPDQQLSKAEDYYKKAASYQEANLITTNNPLAAVSSHKNLAQLYMDIGRYDDAELSLKRVVESYKKGEQPAGDGTSDALKQLAEFYRSRTRYEDAARTYNELIDIQEGMTDTRE